MINKTLISKFALLFSLLFSMHSTVSAISYSNFAHNCHVKAADSIYDVKESNLVAEIPEHNIKLYFAKDDKDFGMYRGFILIINDVKKYFRWENVDGNRMPRLKLSDLDKDGKEELIVILNKGYGTGVQEEEVHVIKRDLFFYEILVENPLIPLYKNVQIEKSNEQIAIILNNKKTVLNKKGMTALPYHDLGGGFGHHIRYEVNNNTLYSKVLLGVGTHPGVGEFLVKYKYKNEIFQVESIDFTPASLYLSK